jgi:phospholipid/cholesterol/gamma-HCH transport system ATP-binding protein
MSEEKDSAQMAREQADADAGHLDGSPGEDIRGVVPQIEPSPGLPERLGVRRRKDRVMSIIHTLLPAAQEGIIESLTDEDRRRYNVRPHMLVDAGQRNSVPPPGNQRPNPGPPPNQHQGQLPVEQIAQLPNAGWQSGPGPGGSHRTRPRDPGQGGA